LHRLANALLTVAPRLVAGALRDMIKCQDSD
jgi:hypothetical protein